MRLLGGPKLILSDNQPFSKEFTTAVESTFACRHGTASTYYPQGNGINESSHRLLEHALKTQMHNSLTQFEPSYRARLWLTTRARTRLRENLHTDWLSGKMSTSPAGTYWSGSQKRASA